MAVPLKGPKSDQDDYKGPLERRSCTDILCTVLFLSCFLEFIAVGIWAYVQGDPRILLYPTDSQGNLCGYGKFRDKPYIFYFDLLDCAVAGPSVAVTGCPTPQVCVAECPSSNWVFLQAVLDRSQRSNLICKYNVDPNSQSVEDLILHEDCAAYYLRSSPIVGHCVPSKVTEFLNSAGDLLTSDSGVKMVDKFNQAVSGTGVINGTRYLEIFLNARDVGKKVIQDVRISWKLIIGGLVLAMVWSFIWIQLLRLLAGIIVWISILLFTLFFAAGSGFCFYKFYDLHKAVENQSGTIDFAIHLDSYNNLTRTWFALGIIQFSLLLVTLLILLFLRKRISIAIELIKEASR